MKGDVNGDGRVDVEDVTSVVDLVLSGKTYGYFYFGTTQPMADNYQSLPGVVASYTSIGDAIGTTASIDAGQTLYMLCPAAWMKGKKVVVVDGAGSTYNFMDDVDSETIPGYVIYCTQACNEATDLTLNFEITGGDEYYWYIGPENPSSMGSIDPKVEDGDMSSPGWRRIENDLSTYNSSNMLWNGVNNEISFGSRIYSYIAVPYKPLQMYDITGNDGMFYTIQNNGEPITIDGVQYYIYKSDYKTGGFSYNIYNK